MIVAHMPGFQRVATQKSTFRGPGSMHRAVSASLGRRRGVNRMFTVLIQANDLNKWCVVEHIITIVLSKPHGHAVGGRSTPKVVVLGLAID